MAMRWIAVGAVSLVAFAGCGSEDAPETPTACLGTERDYLAALEAAPEPVRLANDTPISACLVKEQEPGALAATGKAMTDAVDALNREARENRGEAQPALELGYLVGAVDTAAETTGGIHQDLRLRLNSAARFVAEGEQPLDTQFERAFSEGYAAGRAEG